GDLVEDDRLERGVLALAAQVLGGEELGGAIPVVGLFQSDQERQVGVAAHVVVEVGGGALDEELPQDDVPHGHGQRAVGAGTGGQPLVGELGAVGVVGGDHDDLLPPVAGLGHPVRVRGAGDRDVGPPHDEVAGVPPVTGLGNI